MTGVPCAAFRPSQARVLCASAPLPEPRALLLWPGPQRQLRPLRVSPLRALQEARQGRCAECVSVPGQRRRRSLRNKAKVRTTRTRPGLFVFSVCARISHRKLLGGTFRELVFLLDRALSRLRSLQQAEWLQKTVDQIRKFDLKKAPCDVFCLSCEPAIVAGRSAVGSGRPWKRTVTAKMRHRSLTLCEGRRSEATRCYA